MNPPSHEPPVWPSGRSDFWELHRQLADCYVADLAQAQPQPPPSESRGFEAHGTRHSCASVSARSHVPSSSVESLGPQQRVASVRTRRKQTWKSLAGLQGLYLAEETEEITLDSMDLKLHECWAKGSQLKQQPAMQSRRLSAEFFSPAPTGATDRSSPNKAERPSCVLHPGGTARTVWNLLVAVGVLHDLLMVPLYVFELPESGFLLFLEWTTMLFWNLDCVVSLRTGFYDQGSLVMSPWRIFLHYARSWLLFDASLVSLDWFLLGSSAADGGEGWRSLRLLRFLRLVRMLRWLKLRRAHDALQELLHSQASSLYFSLFSSIAHLLILNHLIACAWFATSRLQAQNWVSDLDMEAESKEYQYLTCMNWAFAQLGVGSSQAKATNTLEMVFCIVIAFRSLITSSTLISTVSNLMGGLSKIKEDENKEFRLLRCYLQHNDIPLALSQKVTQFLQYQYALRQEARSADMAVPLLDLLSQQLQGELQFEKYRRALCRLPLLDQLLDPPDLQVKQVLHRMAMAALRNSVVASRDVIFLGGTRAEAAYLSLSGSLTYFHDDGPEAVDDSVWIAEVCLWTPWVYLGDLVANDVSRLAVLDAQAFCSTLGASWATHQAARRYAQSFLESLKKHNRWTDILPAVEDDFSVESRSPPPSQCCPRLRLKSVVPTPN
ncbi:unnamed protein product [Effrenium voratum]|uniref:Ion transport domain-containing protein n=1 Tax=Effrenium voratum TaxID=2562239 RepID=A0AA36I7K9_9DINO|nr:unnamed protein product [Effrenium voratum]